MLYTALTRKALRLCYEAHKDQTDKAGTPYVFHPFHLAEQMPDESTTITALLHDVMEDTDLCLEDLRREGYPEPVLKALDLLTRRKTEAYMDYIGRIRNNPIARMVKLADLRHNSDLSRLPCVTPKDLERIEKYRAAAALLEGEGE